MVLYYVLIVAGLCTVPQDPRIEGQPDMATYKIVETKKTEIERFASWFHQDWMLVFSDFHEGAAEYVQSLPRERRINLHRELLQFIDNHRDSSTEELRKDWFRLGAHAWQPNLDIRAALGLFAETVKVKD